MSLNGGPSFRHVFSYCCTSPFIQLLRLKTASRHIAADRNGQTPLLISSWAPSALSTQSPGRPSFIFWVARKSWPASNIFLFIMCTSTIVTFARGGGTCEIGKFQQNSTGMRKKSLWKCGTNRWVVEARNQWCWVSRRERASRNGNGCGKSIFLERFEYCLRVLCFNLK